MGIILKGIKFIRIFHDSSKFRYKKASSVSEEAFLSQVKYYPKYVFRILLLEGCFNRLMAFSLIWRTRSLVRSNLSPISSNVIGCFPFKPKYNLTTSASRAVNVDNDLSISRLKDSVNKPLSGPGVSSLVNTSYMFELLSSPSFKGASIDTCLPAFLRDCLTSSGVISNKSANSSAEGGLSNSCSSLEKALLILLIDPILLSGKRTILDCSAKACRID